MDVAEVAPTLDGTNRLRIALVTETYPPEINGVANTLHQMVKGLADRGHEVILLRPAQGKKDRTPRNEGRIHEIPTGGVPLPFYHGLQMGLPATRVIGRTFREFRPNLVYIATEGPLGSSAQRVARRFHLPVVAGFHTNFQTYSRHYGMGLFAPTVLAYLRRFHNRCARTLVPTPALAQELARRDFQRLSVWPRGVDVELFNPARRDRQLRSAWGVDDDSVVVQYVGRLAREKNIDLAIKAFTAIRARRPDARLVLVGDGPELPRIRDENPEFIVTGAQVGEALAAHYASADLFLFPSTSETFGNVITEAMASGLAVVSFRMAAARELLHQAINGLVAEPGDEEDFLRQALLGAEEEGLRKTMAAQARRDALRLGWPEVIGRLEQIFLHTLETPSRGHTNESLATTVE